MSNAPRLVLASNTEVKDALKNLAAFVTKAEQGSYKAVIFPLAAFSSGQTRKKLAKLKQLVMERKISLEAGGWDLSSMVPRKHFFFHKDSFRMVEGKRVKDHHFCPTSLNAIKIIKTEGKKILEAAAGIEVFHLWPDKGAETAWCSCPTCRAFTVQEQGRIAVNVAADVLLAINPNASVTYFEKPNESCNIALRKNIEILKEL